MQLRLVEIQSGLLNKLSGFRILARICESLSRRELGNIGLMEFSNIICKPLQITTTTSRQLILVRAMISPTLRCRCQDVSLYSRAIMTLFDASSFWMGFIIEHLSELDPKKELCRWYVSFERSDLGINLGRRSCESPTDRQVPTAQRSLNCSPSLVSPQISPHWKDMHRRKMQLHQASMDL